MPEQGVERSRYTPQRRSAVCRYWCISKRGGFGDPHASAGWRMRRHRISSPRHCGCADAGLMAVAMMMIGW